MAVQALFHPNSVGFWLGLTSVLGCHETWMGDSNLVAVDFVINQTQVCPGLWICAPALLTCLGQRNGCWACEEVLGVVLASETGTSALDHRCVQVWLVSVPWERAAQDCVPVIHVRSEKYGATESPSLQIHVLPPGSSHSSYQSYSEKADANMTKKKNPVSTGSQLFCRGWTLWCLLCV